MARAKPDPSLVPDDLTRPVGSWGDLPTTLRRFTFAAFAIVGVSVFALIALYAAAPEPARLAGVKLIAGRMFVGGIVAGLLLFVLWLAVAAAWRARDRR